MKKGVGESGDQSSKDHQEVIYETLFAAAAIEFGWCSRMGQARDERRCGGGP